MTPLQTWITLPALLAAIAAALYFAGEALDYLVYRAVSKWDRG